MQSSSLLDTLSDLSPQQRETLVAHATPSVLAGLQGEIRERTITDGLFFLRFVRTRDEADPDHPVKAFPLYLHYIHELWSVLELRQRVVIAKSRQMLVSWILCAFACWWARSRSNQAIYLQTQKAEDAFAFVANASKKPYGRCHFIEAHLPPFLQHAVDGSEGMLVYPNGSFIQGLAGGADQIRGKVASIIVEDEFAFQPEASGVFTAVSPLVQKGAKLILVSTPNGAENTFSKVYHGAM